MVVKDRSIFRMSYPLQIHAWGGFGSQLNALATALLLKELLPARKCVLILHNGGITQRDIEISSLVPTDIEVGYIYDFSKNVSGRKGSRLLKLTMIRKVASLLLKPMKFVIQVDDIEDLRKIRPWTIQIRGHYSYFRFTDKTLQTLIEMILAESKSFSSTDNNILHYRLGDLLKNQKGDIGPDAITKIVKEIGSIQDLHIYSESIDEVLARLSVPLKGVVLKLHGPEIPPIDVLASCINCAIFIGTNSKISIWAAILRSFIGKESTYLPRQLGDTLSMNLDEIKYKLIHFY